MILYLDTETYCEVPLSNGTHSYAREAEIMIESWAIDDGPVQVTDRTAGEAGPFELFDIDDFEWIVFHNSDFDRIVYRYQDVEIPVAKIWDTQVQAREHGLPGGLDKLCQIFRVPEALAKHGEGKSLIQLFCKPRPKSSQLRRATRTTHPEEWERFKSYAGGDIHAMRYLKNKLPTWNYPNLQTNNLSEHRLWVLDQKINDRGFKVDVELAEAAIETVATAQAKSKDDVHEMTEGRLRAISQRDALLRELCTELGVFLPDLQAYTIEKRLEDPDLPEPARLLLEERLMMTVSSVAKYNKLLKAVSEDGRLRGTLTFCGASRTKRDAGKIFQPQNLPRPDMEQGLIEHAIEMMKLGLGDALDEPMRASWNALRGLIIADEGRKLLQADLSGIEARVLPWLAGERWKLKAWRDYDEGRGPKLYNVGAARILDIPVEDVKKEDIQAYGKVPELACGYGGAAGAFLSMAKVYGLELPRHQVDEIVRAWRLRNPAIADWDDGLWAKLDAAARRAIQTPGAICQAGDYIAFEKWRNWLKMHLPSGGFLSYASPSIGPDPRRPNKSTILYWGINSYTRKWEQISTYGGKLSADATQSTAREIFVANWQRVEDAGYPIILRVHDELVTEPLDDPKYSVKGLIEQLTHRPHWVDDKLPLAAGGFEAYRYKKDD